MNTFLVLGVEELATKRTKGRTRKTFMEIQRLGSPSDNGRLGACPRPPSVDEGDRGRTCTYT